MQKGYLFLAVVAALVVVKAVAVVFGRSPVDTFRLKPTGRAVSTAVIFSIMARQAALAAAMSSKDAIVASAKWRMAITTTKVFYGSSDDGSHILTIGGTNNGCVKSGNEPLSSLRDAQGFAGIN